MVGVQGRSPDGYQYSQFVAHYRRYERKLSVVLRQAHRAGEKVFVDFCDGIALTDPVTGDKAPTQLFVAALGASSYTFATATATLSQSLPAWLDCHVRMYTFYGGVRALTIPDNLRAGLTRPSCRSATGMNTSAPDGSPTPSSTGSRTTLIASSSARANRCANNAPR